MGRMISEQKGTEFSGSSYDDIKSIYSIWICMDTKKTDDSIIEFGMKSNLIYGKIKKIPKISKINGALINVRTRTAKNRELSKNRLIAMLEELFSKSEFLEKKKILEEDYGLKMSVELEGRMNEMCNVSDYWEEIALQTGRKEGREEGRKAGYFTVNLEQTSGKGKWNFSVYDADNGNQELETKPLASNYTSGIYNFRPGRSVYIKVERVTDAEISILG